MNVLCEYLLAICHNHDAPTWTDLIGLREAALSIEVVFDHAVLDGNAKYDGNYLEADVEEK